MTTFHDPHVALNCIYTKRGDSGETSLVGGQRVAKDDPRIACFGVVDELNAVVGLAAVSCLEDGRLSRLGAILGRVQHELFNLGSQLATLPADLHPRQPKIEETDVARLEREIDEMNSALPPLRSFVLPGGCRVNAELHLARTVCRRAERDAVGLARTGEAPAEALRYLNRLSDALFVWSRWASAQLKTTEVTWKPNEPSEFLHS